MATIFVLHPKKMEFPLMYGCIIKILYWLGIVKHPEDRSIWRWITPIVLNACIVLLFLDNIVMHSLSSYAAEWKLLLEATICSTFSFVSIYTLLQKRRIFSAILHSNIKAFANRKFNTLAGCLVLLLVIHPFTIITKLYMESNYLALRFYTYQIDMDCKALQFLIVYVKILASYFMMPILPSVLAVVYCTLCHQCCLALEAITQRITKHTPLDFTAKVQDAFIERREDVLKKLDDVQAVFSLVSFSVCAVNFSACLIGLTLFFTQNLRKNLLILVDDVFISLVSLTSLMLIFWTAGRVPSEMKKFRREFQKNLKKRALLGFPIEVSGMERLALLEEDYEMSGCDGLLFYRTSSILGVLGSILTYGLLILSIEIQQG